MDNEKKPDISFEEDKFDVEEYQKSKAAFVRTRARINRTKKHISIGRTLIFIAAILILILIYYFSIIFLSQM